MFSILSCPTFRCCLQLCLSHLRACFMLQFFSESGRPFTGEATNRTYCFHIVRCFSAPPCHFVVGQHSLLIVRSMAFAWEICQYCSACRCCIRVITSSFSGPVHISFISVFSPSSFVFPHCSSLTCCADCAHSRNPRSYASVRSSTSCPHPYSIVFASSCPRI